MTSNALGRVYRWRDESAAGLQHLVVQELSQRVSVRGAIIHGETGNACTFAVDCDCDWRFRHAIIDVFGGARLELTFQPPVGWTRNGEAMEGFADAVEIDFVATPFTNTLPIRRLNLDLGQSASIVAAWIDFPSLEVMPDPQRYTRIAQNTYRYESLDSDFTRDVTVDADGFVVDYPGLFARV